MSETESKAMAKPLNEKTSSTRRPARDRLLSAADELFYGHGINVVGIDRVIEKAGVAKASLYECFDGKENLIRSYVQARDERRRARRRPPLHPHRIAPTPRRRRRAP